MGTRVASGLHSWGGMRLRFATLNAWALPLFAKHVSPRMRAIGERLGALELDAIAFQEVWTPSARRVLLEAGRRAGLANVWHRDRFLFGSGLLVLSRLPIEDVDFDRFALRGGRLRRDELLGGKGFAKVRLLTPAGILTLFDTHLHAGTASVGSSKYHAQRTAQIVQLSHEVREIRGPVIVLGDLNCEESDPEHCVLRGLTGLRDVAAELDRRAPTAARANPYRGDNGKPDRRIDYVLARDGEPLALRALSLSLAFDEPFLLDGRPAACSNHTGIVADLELTPGSAAPRRAADPEALALAARLLDEGADVAREVREQGRVWAGAGMALAVLAAGSRRALPADRRGFLRGALQLGALAALAPGVGISLSSEWLVPDEIDAFREARSVLTRIHDDAARPRLA